MPIFNREYSMIKIDETIDLSVLDTFIGSSAEEILIFSSVLLYLYGGRVNSSSVKKRLNEPFNLLVH